MDVTSSNGAGGAEAIGPCDGREKHYSGNVSVEDRTDTRQKTVDARLPQSEVVGEEMGKKRKDRLFFGTLSFGVLARIKSYSGPQPRGLLTTSIVLMTSHASQIYSINFHSSSVVRAYYLRELN